MKRFFLVAISTLLRFLGQFLFIKSVSHLGERMILETLNLQSLAVLLAGFSSGGIQTYLSKFIPLDKIKDAWTLGSRNTLKYYFYSILFLVPAYFVINKIQTPLILTLGVILLALLLAYSNNWQGLLTGLKKYTGLINIYAIQVLLFLLLFIFKDSFSDNLYYIAYPLVVVISFLVSYFLNKSSLISSGPTEITSGLQSEISSYRTMGIVIMTAGVAYPFIVRNLLTSTFTIDIVVNWDYLMRISTAYVSVSTFFIFTLFSSDLSHNVKSKKHFVASALLLIIGYLTIFYFFNRPILKILLSREIILTQTELLSFIGFEFVRSFFSLLCLYSIIRGDSVRYISLELTNLAVSMVIIFLLKPLSLENSFQLLLISFLISALCIYLVKVFKTKV